MLQLNKNIGYQTVSKKHRIFLEHDGHVLIALNESGTTEAFRGLMKLFYQKHRHRNLNNLSFLILILKFLSQYKRNFCHAFKTFLFIPHFYNIKISSAKKR